jgi:hypothetical protein
MDLHSTITPSYRLIERGTSEYDSKNKYSQIPTDDISISMPVTDYNLPNKKYKKMKKFDEHTHFKIEFESKEGNQESCRKNLLGELSPIDKLP